MAVDIEEIKSILVKVARIPVGAQLSNVGTTQNPIPAVIQARPKEGYPDYPYIVVDILDEQDDSGPVIWEGLDENCEVAYYFHKLLLCSFMCYGPNSQSILSKLKNFFEMDSTTFSISKECGGEIQELSGIEHLPFPVSDKIISCSQLTLILSVPDSIVDESAGYADTLNIHGEIHRHIEDEEPFQVDIIVP